MKINQKIKTAKIHVFDISTDGRQ